MVPAIMLNGDKEENELPGKEQLNVEKSEDEQSNILMQSNAFAHRIKNVIGAETVVVYFLSVADGDAMEQLMRMIDAQIDDGREDIPVQFSVDDPRTTGEISWSAPEIFDIPLVIDANIKLESALLIIVICTSGSLLIVQNQRKINQIRMRRAIIGVFECETATFPNFIGV
uniref:Uncharacterized protein n=1 Tax=Parascaris equorum TaxID=6256 RepID=A0A914S3W8_PAREQ